MAALKLTIKGCDQFGCKRGLTMEAALAADDYNLKFYSIWGGALAADLLADFRTASALSFISQNSSFVI